MTIRNLTKRIALGIGIVATLILGSCSETIDVARQRQYDNEQAFLKFADSTGYERISLPGMYSDAYVYIKWLEKGMGTSKPKMTDYIRMHYRGYLLTSWVKDQSGLFDSNYGSTNPRPTAISRTKEGLIEGMGIALQSMVEGDHVSVVIPWYLAYGANIMPSIPSYSALRFEVKLLKIEGVTTNE